MVSRPSMTSLWVLLYVHHATAASATKNRTTTTRSGTCPRRRRLKIDDLPARARCSCSPDGRIILARSFQRMTSRPAAIIFDLDGTLADTFDLIVSSWNAACAEPMGRTYTAAEVIARFGPTESDMLRRELPAAHHVAALKTFLTR